MGGKKKIGAGLFEEFQEDWKEHWQGMPEFISEDLQPYRTIRIHFESKEAVKEFSKLIGQNITPETRYLYFPKVEVKRCTSDKEYIDES